MPTDTTTLRSPTRYFWLHLATLGAGSAALVLTPRVANAVALALAVVAVAVAAVARATYVIVTSAFSDAYRVFRSRHLFVCSLLLFAMASVVIGSMLLQEPFQRLFAHGRLTGDDIADLGTMVAAVVCGVGSGVAVTGAWDRLHVERHWYRSLHPRPR